MTITEEQLKLWSRPVSTTEDEKCKNAISQVTDAIRKKFGNNVSIFLQGSYRNNTNVRQDSDVDIVIEHNGYYFPNLDWLSKEDKEIFHEKNPNSTYSFAQYKQEVHDSLNSVFGNVQRKNKCIKVPGNSYRVNADAVPCFQMKRFTDVSNIDAVGIEIRTDDGTSLQSYPEQHYVKGTKKTEATGRMYKRCVRMLKYIRNKLIENNSITEDLVSSFLIECLVFNVPNEHFNPVNYTQTLQNVMVIIYNDMKDAERSKNYEEVSGLKWLFRGNSRTSQNAETFLFNSMDYMGFKR